MIRMTGGTNSVATMRPNTTFFPRKLMRAKGYAASAAVQTTRIECDVAAIMLLRNHRSTGVPAALRIES
jgi:hypothetical protein